MPKKTKAKGKNIPAKWKGKSAKKVADKEIKKKTLFNVTSVVSKGLQCTFPDRFYTKVKTKYTQTLLCPNGTIPTSTVGTAIFGNALTNPIAPVQSGANPFTFGTGTAISGLGFLLSGVGTTATGAYSAYRIHGSSIKTTWMNTNSNTQNGVITICPMLLDTINAIGDLNNPAFSFQQLGELPRAKTKAIDATTFNGGVVVKSHETTARQNGLKYKSQIEDASYLGFIGSNPNANLIWAWVVALSPARATGQPSYDVEIEVEYQIEFCQRNYLPPVTA